jgi:hypothetical protein
MNSQMYIDDAMLATYRSWAEAVCAPVFWRMSDGRMNNGTITFLRTTSTVLGLTNKHVADGLKNSDNRGWQLANAQFDPDRIIAVHPQLDLATYQLSDVFLAAAGKHAATVTTWPPTRPFMDQPIALGGFPGMYRQPSGPNISFGFAWFAGKVNVEGDANIGIVLDLNESIATTRDRIPAGANLGGCSGGPVFRVIESNRLERLELAAIIDQCSSSSETLLARPLQALADDGTFIN